MSNPFDDYSLLSDLLNDAKLYPSSTEYKQLLDFTIKQRRFAPFNAMLLHIQKPGLRFAASASEWRQKFARDVKEGARPLLIMWPFGPVSLMYDFEDTEGESLPEVIEKAFTAKGRITAEFMAAVPERLGRAGIGVSFAPFGDGLAGNIGAQPAAPESEQMEIEALSLSTKRNSKGSYRLRINSKHDPNVQFSTLAHELGHLCLGHLGRDVKLQIPSRMELTIAQREFEAESVSHIVCERSEVTAYAHKYLSQYLDGGELDVELDYHLIFRAAGKVEQLLGLNQQSDER